MLISSEFTLVSKVGRNDPCPCDSGIKYKKCCYAAERQGRQKKTSSSTLKNAKAAMLESQLMAQKLLGQSPQSEEKRSISLLLDRFAIESDSALIELKKLGENQGDTVLFYEEEQWVGEADFSISGELILTTTRQGIADALRSKLELIEGVVHRSRTEDTFQALSQEERANVARDMGDFKTRFFQTWLDEKNEKLDGRTPREAVSDPSSKLKLVQLLEELERREKELPKKERYNFKTVRKELGL